MINNIILFPWLPRKQKENKFTVGWISSKTFPYKLRHVFYINMNDVLRIRQQFIPEWINRNSDMFYNEIYQPNHKYDFVVFLKSTNKVFQDEATRIRKYGGKVIFDANVNYYEIWGDYFVPGTRPTEEQQRDAIWMAKNSDWVVADSTYLEKIIRKHTENVSFIPDNVNLDIYCDTRKHSEVDTVTFVWSGISKKAAHFNSIKGALKRISDLHRCRLLLVSDQNSKIVKELQGIIDCNFEHFKNDAYYARLLAQSDIIISPKNFCNGYEMGHTEYKIALGMAAGLPAVASPQQSYIEAVSFDNGGIIANNEDEWFKALHALSTDSELRKDMGQRARRTIVEKYSTPVIARRYLTLFEELSRKRNPIN